MDLRTLSRAYDRSAESYDARFRELQVVKYRAAAALLEQHGALPAPGAWVLDAGGGTGLLAEWARQECPPLSRVVVLDASLGMLRIARERALPCVAADLALPPLRPRSFPLVVAFTSVLERVPQALDALAELLVPRGALLCTFLRAEAPTRLPAALRMTARAEAGQDVLLLLRRGEAP